MRCTIRGKGNAKRRKKYKIRKKERGATNNDDKWMGQKKTKKTKKRKLHTSMCFVHLQKRVDVK